jgi:fructosamine-3-kinase
MEGSVADRVAERLDATPTGATALDGGHVGRVYRVCFADRPPVAAKVGPTPLDVEAEMLAYLARETTLPVPAVLAADPDLLVMSYVEGDGAVTPAVERHLADLLADLHGVTADACGFPFDTLSGPYRQPNPWTDSWVAFFREQRLSLWADDAVSEGVLGTETRGRIARVADRLDELLVEPDAPALLHGDVWTGNLVVDDGAVRAVLDPALYYGHPELELAYVDRFGGVGDAFFDRYREHREVPAAFFDTRRHVYALVPLLEHVRVFGESYLGDLRATLDRLGV